MSSYIVSARKYRPDNFGTLIGQDNIARTLKNSLLRGQLAQAYLFCGPRGVGKTTTARIFAKMINCSNPGEDMEPCGQCESCLSFAENRSYCIHELDAASNNGVEDIKALIDQVRIPPQVGKYSVYIIDEVHMLSTNAFNAFLKTLEEPPAHAVFILATTEKHKILPTILSRCQTYDFNRISVEDMVRNLRMIAQKENVSIEDDSLHVIAEKADGAMRDALTIFDQTVAFCGTSIQYDDVIRNLNVLSYKHSFALVESFLKGDYASALLKLDEVLGKGFNILHFISSLSNHLRNLIVSKTAGLEGLLELPDSQKALYKEQADKCSLKYLYDALGITVQCEASYKNAINPRLHMEFCLMKLCFLNTPGMAQPAVTQPKAAQNQTQTSRPAPATDPMPTATPARQQAPSQPSQPANAPAASKENDLSREERRRNSLKNISSGLSMKSLTENGQQNMEKVEIAEDGKWPEEDEIRENWQKIAQAYSSKPRLSSAITSGILLMTKMEDYVLTSFQVANEAQQKWLQDKMQSELEGRLQSLLGTGRIKLAIDVVPQEEQEKVAYTSTEQATEMIKANPELKNLIDDLDATIK